MTHSPLSLASDNQAPVHPEILKALSQVTQSESSCYDTDPETQALFQWLKNSCGDFEFSTCANGTAANVLSIGCQLHSHEAVLCQSESHLSVDSCSALEKNFGIKVLARDGYDGFLTQSCVEKEWVRRGDQHHAQLRMIHLAWPDERGRCMPLDSIQEIRTFANQHQLLLHLDGARLLNGVTVTGIQLKEILQHFDSFSLGGSKNGLMFGELFGVRKPLTPIKYLKKQHLNLLTKTRYISAQFLTYLTTDLGSSIAVHAHTKARELAALLSSYDIEVLQPVETNMVFARLDRTLFKAIRKHIHIFQWTNDPLVVRFVTSWFTDEHHLLAIRQVLENDRAQSESKERL